MKRLLWGVVFLLVVLSLPETASAHGYIVRAIPENRAVLERPPTRLQYWFSEALEPDFSSINLRNQSGEIIATGGISDTDNTLMTVRVPNDLPEGAYIVELRPAFASDGHVVAESRVFFVGEEVGGVAGQSASGQAVPLEVFWRVLVYTATLTLFGAFAGYGLIFVPAWGNKAFRAGLLPPRVMNRLNWIVGLALILVFLGNGLALIQQTMTFFGIGFTQALNQDFWSVVRIGSRFGDVWNFRMGFLLVVAAMFGASLYFRASQPETVRAFWVANTWMMALVIGTFSVLSHAAGSLTLPWLGIGIDWLHALAVGLWAGGLVVMVWVLPVALRPYDTEQRRQALLAVLRQFSRWAAACVFIVIATGLYSASNWIYSADDAATGFGLSLFVKILLVIVLVALGAVHHIALRPAQYARFSTLIKRLDGFLPTLRLEAIAVLAVLVAVGWLSATPVPVPDFAETEVETPGEIQTAFGYNVVMTISPGGPGVNTYDVNLSRDNVALDDLDIRLTMVNPSQDWRSPVHQLEAVDSGLYVTAADDIDQLGRWWTLMDVTGDDGDTTRFAFEWNISNEASVIQSRDLTLTNVIPLVLVVLALGWALYPAARWLYLRLDLSPLIVLVVFGATVITVLLIIVGGDMVSSTRERYDERLNPAPEIVNAVLPSQASLARGETLYAEYCIEWQSYSQDFRALRQRLDRIRDEELYSAIVDGWRTLPPCAERLTSFERWDLVNYIRTLQEFDS
ncbi:MAG: CopD family protein [Aggregatilineales bacterium]